MDVLAIDPGLRGCGVALYRASILVEAAYVRGPVAGRGPEAWGIMADNVLLAFQASRLAKPLDVVLESQKIYTVGKSQGRPDDLLELRGVMATIARDYATLGGRVVSYLPSEWKGQVPKEVHHRRLQAAVSPTERTIINQALHGLAASLAHNVWDAVGLGRAHLTKQRRANAA
jgi:hypothetical protein